MRSLPAIFLFLLLVPLTGLGQPSMADTPRTIVSNLKYKQELNIAYSQLYVINSDIGDITFGDQGHPDGRQYILNGNIIPNFYVTPRNWRTIVVLSPIVRVRIIANQHSRPVRTPSFVPGGQIYFPLNRDSLKRYKYASLGFFHHSNGQDGPPLDGSGNPNLYNGDFSTNLLTLNYHWGNIGERHNWYYRLGPELHGGLVKWADIPQYRDRFGKVRLNYHIAYTRFTRFVNRFLRNGVAIDSTSTEEERVRFVACGMFVLDNIDADLNQRFNIELKCYYKIPGSENSAFFGSLGYMGHDYYNIYFYQPYPFIRIGFAASNAFLYNPRFKAQRRRVEEMRRRVAGL